MQEGLILAKVNQSARSWYVIYFMFCLRLFAEAEGAVPLQNLRVNARDPRPLTSLPMHEAVRLPPEVLNMGQHTRASFSSIGVQ